MLVNWRNFITKEELYHPASLAYLNFWKEEKRRCIEGYWVGGTYMPPQLYFYINYWHILLNETANSKAQVVAKPYLRSPIDWTKGYLFLTARGFSGFADDNEYTCNERWKEVGVDDKGKKFLSPMLYLSTRGNNVKALGKPLYENQAKNVADFECFSPETKVLMYDGSVKEIGMITIGELLMGPDSTSREVINKNTGSGKRYKIVSKRFTDQIVNGKHLVAIEKRIHVNGKYANGKRQKASRYIDKQEISVENILKIQDKAGFHNTHYLYQSSQLDFEPQEKPPIDPYYLGLWLSDGRSNCTSIKITDTVLSDYLKEFAEENNIRYIQKFVRRIKPHHKDAIETYYYDETFRGEFKKLGLIGYKHIPPLYQTASVEDRKALLAGLIDGDGCYDTKCQSWSIYTGPHLHLAQDVKKLIGSLGHYSSIKHDVRDNCYAVLLSSQTNPELPIKLKRKYYRQFERRLNVLRSSFYIEPYEDGEFVGLEVDSDNLFLLADYQVVHNCRGGGKSFGAASNIGHTFLFDGATDYDEYLFKKKNGLETAAIIGIGAIDSKYSVPLIDKVKLGLDKLPGKRTIGNRSYPSPLERAYYGSFGVNKGIKAGFQVKYEGRQDQEGSASAIYHRVFKDNPSALSGQRSNLIVIEEAGFMNNLLAAMGQMKNVTEVSGSKFGTIWLQGTGGENESEAIDQVKEIFHNPEEWDCVAFDDEYDEANMNKIGFFVPCFKIDTHFMDRETGVVDEIAAKTHHEKERARLQKGNSPQRYHDEIINNPFSYKEAFYLKTGSIFPTQDLSDHLGWLETQKDDRYTGLFGKLRREGTEVKFVREKGIVPVPYPLNRGALREGCVTIWEEPFKDISGTVPSGLYVAGCDPYDQDEGGSLGSITIWKRFIGLDQSFDWPVASYHARPDLADDFYENCMMLLDYYNSLCLYENNLKGILTYARNHGRIHRFATSPVTFKSTERSTVNRQYGVHMIDIIKSELELYSKDWMNTEYEPGKKNLTKILDKELLKELIAYNREGNFDRVISFMLSIGQRKEIENVRAKAVTEVVERRRPFKNRLFV